MEENIILPYEKLAQDCEIIDPKNPKESINKISNLNSSFPNEHLVLIFNYFFEHSNSYDILIFLLKRLDKLRDKSSLSTLIDSLLMKGKFVGRISDPDQITSLRVQITKVLANTKDSQAVYPLLYCLNSKDENYKIKLSCAEALGRIGDKYAVLPLMNVVEDESESSVYVKESAVSALGMIGDEKAVDSLVLILESKKGFLDKFTFLKERALEALNKLSFRSERAFNAVVKSLRDESPQVRINAIEVLMNSEDDRAVDLITGMLADINQEVVKNAVIALYNLLGDEIIDRIINNPDMPKLAIEEAKSLLEDLAAEEELDEE